MADRIEPLSPLEGLLVPRQPEDEPGVRIRERRNLAQLQIVARKGRVSALRRRLGEFHKSPLPPEPLAGIAARDILVFATGPLEFWAVSDRRHAAEFAAAAEAALGDAASVFDQSNARAMLRLEGPRTNDLLASGTALDLHPRAFPACGGTHTVIERIPVLVLRHGPPPVVDVSLPRSYASSFARWLIDAARGLAPAILPPG